MEVSINKVGVTGEYLGTVSVCYGRCSHGDRFCHSRITVGREESKDKDKMLVQINMRDEQKERSTQKRLRRNY